jgi:hypothetical protein
MQESALHDRRAQNDLATHLWRIILADKTHRRSLDPPLPIPIVRAGVRSAGLRSISRGRPRNEASTLNALRGPMLRYAAS